MLQQYTGNTPSNVSKKAKYAVVSGPGGDRVRLRYQIDRREYELLTTDKHPRLCAMVNVIKQEFGTERGVFYINEFHDVLIPGADGGCYFAGHYEPILEFAFEGRTVGPTAPEGLRPGDTWPGPHVGIAHVLRAGGKDIMYKSRNGNRYREVCLSDEVGAAPAARVALRLSRYITTSGGRFYINEASEMFCPARGEEDVNPTYLGHLGEDLWFSPPKEFARP